jgi:hypothetical protein
MRRALSCFLIAAIVAAWMALAVVMAPRCRPGDGAFVVGGVLLAGCRPVAPAIEWRK